MKGGRALAALGLALLLMYLCVTSRAQLRSQSQAPADEVRYSLLSGTKVVGVEINGKEGDDTWYLSYRTASLGHGPAGDAVIAFDENQIPITIQSHGHDSEGYA